MLSRESEASMRLLPLEGKAQESLSLRGKHDEGKDVVLTSPVKVGGSFLYHGDCREVLKSLESESVDLVVTSPPYADRRKGSGTAPGNYVGWFLPIAEELKRILKPEGTFILNIKEHCTDGQRNTYVLKLILALVEKQGWIWTEQFIWHKRTAMPGKWPNRFRDAWERLLQLNKSRKFKMFQDAVKTPTGDWTGKRLSKLGKGDFYRHVSDTGSGFGRNMLHWVGKEYVYPTNVLHLAPVCHNKRHSATFPDSLPDWFVKLFTERGDTVLDPFVGSGTTCVIAERRGRKSIGIEVCKDYLNMCVENVRAAQVPK